MSVKVQLHANGKCPMKRDSYPPTAEELANEVDYSDGGYPTLPRPKVILSIPRPDSPWSAREASQLQTVPIRLQNGHRPRARTVSPPAPQTNKVRGGNSVAAATTYSRTCKQQAANQPCDVVERGVTCRLNRTAVIDNPSALPARSNSWGSSRSAFRRLDGQRVNSPSGGINNSSIATTSTSYGCIDPESGSPNRRDRSRSEIPTRIVETTMSQGKGKKTKKPSRALTFSFGDRKKRSLSSVFGTFRRQANDDCVLGLSRGNVSPSSPILLGRRRAQKKGSMVPSPILRSSNLREQCIVEERERGSTSSIEEWGNESCPRTPVVSENGDAQTQIWRLRSGSGRENSGIEDGRNSHSRHQFSSVSSNGSTTTALDAHAQQNDHERHPLPSPGLVSVGEASSLRESVESIARSNSLDTPPASAPTSRRQSPCLRKSSPKGQELPPLSADSDKGVGMAAVHVTPPRLRKLSDPVVSTPEGSPTQQRKGNGRGVKLRKGHSFCVSQSRAARQVPDWVSI